MASTRIRFRNDGWHLAEMKAEGRTADEIRKWGYEQEWVEKFIEMPLPLPGDIWRVRWYKADGEEGPIAGYAICCPRCLKVHAWTSALNCKPCPHQGKSSCWNWTGSAEDGTLSASPSLFASGACGWHGWLRNGVLEG